VYDGPEPRLAEVAVVARGHKKVLRAQLLDESKEGSKQGRKEVRGRKEGRKERRKEGRKKRSTWTIIASSGFTPPKYASTVVSFQKTSSVKSQPCMIQIASGRVARSPATTARLEAAR